MSELARDPELKPAGDVSPVADVVHDWPLDCGTRFSWPSSPVGVFALTFRHEALGVFERYETGGPEMRSHP